MTVFPSFVILVSKFAMKASKDYFQLTTTYSYNLLQATIFVNKGLKVPFIVFKYNKLNVYGPILGQ
jgi:hypothetical protein